MVPQYSKIYLFIYLFIYFIYIPPHSRSSLGGLQKLKTVNIKTNIQNLKPEKLKNMSIHIKTTILFWGPLRETNSTHVVKCLGEEVGLDLVPKR